MSKASRNELTSKWTLSSSLSTNNFTWSSENLHPRTPRIDKQDFTTLSSDRSPPSYPPWWRRRSSIVPWDENDWICWDNFEKNLPPPRFILTNIFSLANQMTRPTISPLQELTPDHLSPLQQQPPAQPQPQQKPLLEPEPDGFNFREGTSWWEPWKSRKKWNVNYLN